MRLILRVFLDTQEKIERSADASRDRHVPHLPLLKAVLQTGAGNPPTKSIAVVANDFHRVVLYLEGRVPSYVCSFMGTPDVPFLI